MMFIIKLFLQKILQSLLCTKCLRKETQHSVDLAIVFIGTELQSSSINGDRHGDTALVDLLRVSFTRSNFSMAFPYVDASGNDSVKNLIVSEFKESCGNNLGISNGALLGLCTMNEETLLEFSLQHSINEEYFISRMQVKPKGQTDLVVICHNGSHAPSDLDKSFSESETLDKRLYLRWSKWVQNMMFYMFQILSIQFDALHMFQSPLNLSVLQLVMRGLYYL